MTEYRNGPKKWAKFCLFVTLIGFIMIFYPLYSDMDGFNGGFALIFGGVIVTLSFIISALVFFVQGLSLDKAIESSETLAKWSYSKDEWKEYYEVEYLRDKKDKRIIFYIASGFSIFFAIIFLLLTEEPWGVIYACVGIILLTGFLQWFTPWLTYRRNKKYSGVALISPNGIYLNGIWYPNKRFGRIEEVDLIDKNKTLKFEWSQFTMFGGKVPGKNYFTIRVPVPEGEEKTAQKILESFSAL